MTPTVRNVVLSSRARPLDALPLPWFSFGLRRQTTISQMPLVQIHRSSGSPADADFSAANGDFFDSGAAAAFASGVTPTIRSWYEQLQGNHATQTTTASQPGVVFNGSDSYIAFTSGKFLSLSDLNFARYRDGVTVVLVFQLPSNPDATRTLFSFSSSLSAAGVRVWLRSSNASAITMLAAPLDGQSGYSSTPAISVGSAWTVAVLRVDFRNGVAKLLINGTTAVATPAMTECTKTMNTASFGARINGTSSDTGVTMNVKAFLGYDYVVSDAQAQALVDKAYSLISGNKPAVVPPVQASPNFAGAPSKIWLFGDSQFADTLVTNVLLRSTPVLANLNDARGTYRLVINQGVSGQTSTQIRTRLLATTIAASEPVVIIAGQNDDVSTTTANHAAVIANLQAMADYVTSGKYVILTIPFGRDERFVDTVKHGNKQTFNDLVWSTFPNNTVEAAIGLATAAGNSDGATPSSHLVDTFHRNSLGVAVQTGLVDSFIVGKGW